MNMVADHFGALVQNPVLILFCAVTAVIEPPSIARWVGWSIGPPISFAIVNHFNLLTTETIGFDAAHNTDGLAYWIAAYFVCLIWLGVGMLMKARFRAHKRKTAA